MTAEAAAIVAKDRVCCVHTKRIQISTDLSALSEAFARLRYPAVLGGNPARAQADGFSYWAAEPSEVFEFGPGQTEPFAKLESLVGRCGRVTHVSHEVTPPDEMFCGGWIGYIGYEMGRYIETLPQTAKDDLCLPLMRLGFYDRVIAYDHHAGVFWISVLELPGDTEGPRRKIVRMEQLLRESANRLTVRPPAADIERVDPGSVRTNLSRDEYVRAVARVKRHIRDGDVYQVNLAQRFQCPFHGRAIDLFHWQNHYNASPYAAYIDAGDFQVVSASPELFVDMRHDFIRTKPIKGTRPRVAASLPDGEQANARNLNALLTSEKERAELNMIIDLERNDVARICRPGTRHVLQHRTIEAFPTVFHAVATVGGELRPEVKLTDVLRAMFPGGSITGAPKIRAMEIIDALEPTTRGVYTGSIGFVGLDKAVNLNIAIRTVTIAHHEAFVHSGGGIVADSDPQAEWEETVTKARALLAGIEAVQAP
jgi:anthranilate/para-aminobenzoate synthase component I